MLKLATRKKPGKIFEIKILISYDRMFWTEAPAWAYEELTDYLRNAHWEFDADSGIWILPSRQFLDAMVWNAQYRFARKLGNGHSPDNPYCRAEARTDGRVYKAPYISKKLPSRHDRLCAEVLGW